MEPFPLRGPPPFGRSDGRAGDALTVEEVGAALTTYASDEDGNTTVVNASGALTTMTWDHCMERRASGSVGSVFRAVSTAGGVVTSVYDATGLRRQREDASGVTKYLWDGVNLLAEAIAWSEVPPAPRAGRGMARSPRVVGLGLADVSRGDALGTINRLTDASQNVTDTYVLDAWGRPAASSGTTTNPHRYVGSLGYYTEPDLGMDYVRARWLRPATGSWVSVDPVEGEERYGYAAAAPAALVDPEGEGPIDPNRLGKLQRQVQRNPQPRPVDPRPVPEPAPNQGKPYWEKRTHHVAPWMWFFVAPLIIVYVVEYFEMAREDIEQQTGVKQGPIPHRSMSYERRLIEEQDPIHPEERWEQVMYDRQYWDDAR